MLVHGIDGQWSTASGARPVGPGCCPLPGARCSRCVGSSPGQLCACAVQDVHRLLRCKVTPGAPAQASPEMGGAYGEVLSAQDVATWGSLCALATFTRRELKALVIDNLGFREYLETTPEVCPPACMDCRVVWRVQAPTLPVHDHAASRSS